MQGLGLPTGGQQIPVARSRLLIFIVPVAVHRLKHGKCAS
jgi:hypothetical protein